MIPSGLLTDDWLEPMCEKAGLGIVSWHEEREEQIRPTETAWSGRYFD